MLRIALIGAVFAVIGCGGPSATTPSPIQPADLASAPTQVTLAGRTLTLEASLWRDFMPISPPDGKPMIAAARVKSDGGAIPATVKADTLWVLNGTEVWSAPAREERPHTGTDSVYEVVARDGPKWGPGIQVDVVVRLRDANGRVVLLRAAGQTIQSTF